MGQDEITGKEWYRISEITAAIYNMPFHMVFHFVLNSIKDLIPYSHSLSYFIRSENGMNVYFGMQSGDIPEEHIKSYINKYSKLDFINWYSNADHPEVFRESDIIPDELREKAQFMQKWMLPIGIYYGVGVLVANKGIQYGALFVYRSKEEQDFSDKEMEILRVLNHHLCLRFGNLFPEGLCNIYIESCVSEITKIHCLTKREMEIVGNIRNGTLRIDLCDKLHITENTLNKHLDNIYKKLGINTFEELLQSLNQNNG